MKETAYQFNVLGIALDDTTGSPFVILYNKDTGISLPMQVGPSDASSLIVELEGIQPEFSNSHDFLAELFRKHRFTLRHMEIYQYIGGMYRARIVYSKGLRNFSQEVNPSDGIVLCTKFHAPIYIRREIAESATPDITILDEVRRGNSEYLSFDHQSQSLHLM
jgi:bifunctional DNase/RNase